MSKLNQTDQDSIIEALKRVGANQPCPRCGNTEFSVLNGYDNVLISQTIDGHLFPGGPRAPTFSVPAALLACTRCGYLSTHALGALGLLPPEEASR
jgi:ribosomal protein S27AE